MSYNGYTNPNSYSPYFQGTTGQDGREQYTDQSRHSAGYQNSSYQPLSAYQTTQQHPQSSAPRSASISAYGNQGYGNVNGPGSSRSQDGRANYTTGGRQTDTTALGNLAYASTLGRGNTPLQQNMNYTRTQDYGGSTSYGVNSTMPAQYGAGHQRTDSRGATATSREDYAGRSQATTSTPGTGYNPDESNSTYQRQQGSGGGNWQAQAQYIAAQRPSTEQNRLSQYSIQPPRPTSGQAIQYPSSRINAQAVQSPTIPAAQAVLQRRDTSSVRSIDQNRIQSPQQQSNRTIGTPTGFQGGNTTAKPQQQQATGHSSAHHSPKTASLGQPADTSVRPHAAIDTRVNGRTSQLSTPTMSEYPTTVDPSRIFNHVEYQRRQAAAAAEQEAARNKATETAQAAKQPNPNPPNNPQPWKDMARNVVTQPTRTPSTPGSNAPPTTDGDTDPDTAKRTQMELEMKQMIEKMRDYKSKDPSLFSQIWEQVKKGQPPQRAPSISAAQGSRSPVVVNDQLPSSNPDNVQLPPESELPAAEAFPLDFDRGRYPAQRRRRGGASYTPPAKPKSHHKKVKAPAVTSTPIPNGYIAAGCAPDPSTQTMQQAMSNFHRSSGSPMSQTTPQNAPSSVNSSEQSTGRTTMAPSSIAVTSANTLPLAHPPKAGGTYWPENRKRALAEAARKALRSSESNSGKQITTDEIHDLFNQNPSYTQMCEVLEFRGFTIDRSQFARLLLKAVPDLGSASTASISTQQPPSPKQTPVQQSVSRLLHSSPQTNTNGYETPYAAPGASRPPQPQQPHQAQAPPQGPGFIGLNPGLTRPTGPPFTGIAVASTSGQVNTSEIATKNGVKWADQQNPNADSLQLNHLSTKEQMAKKRSFSDIVDLTALSDDEVEEIEPPSQRPRLDNGPPTSAAAALISPPLVTDQAPKKVFETVTLRRLQNESAAATSFQKDKPNLEAFKLQSSRREILQCQDIVRPMNKRQDALRRSSYTAKTIARDILVSMGKHSTMRRLNAHLESLREKFQAVDYNSDLSTFKWDLVDPGGEPVQAPRPGDEGHDADNEDAGGPALSRYHHRLFAEIGAGGKSGVSLLDNVSLHAPVKDIEARRKLGRPSRGSSQRGGFANSGARSKADGPGSYGQQQMPPPAPPLSSAITTNQSAHNFARFVRNYIPSMQTPFIGSTSGSPSFNGVANMTPPNPTSSHSYSNTPIINTPGSDDSPKKNGRRPSGAKNKQPRPDKGTAKKRKEALTTSTANADAPLRTPGSRDMSISTRPRTDTTPARPSGLRNAMSPTSSTGIAVVIPSRSTSIAGTPHAGSHAGSHTASAQSARRDGPKQGPAAVSDMHISQPEYKVYKCQWEKCPAELHNLETLKKHIRKHCYQYTRRDEPYPCLWANCFKPEDDGSNKGENLVFSTDVDWDIHMLKHMNAVAWNLGDGPATHSSDYDTESDARSRQVTPKISLSQRPSQSSASPLTTSHGFLSNSSKIQDSPPQAGLRVVLPPPRSQ